MAETVIIKLCKAQFMCRNLTDVLHVAAYYYFWAGYWAAGLVLFYKKIEVGEYGTVPAEARIWCNFRIPR